MMDLWKTLQVAGSIFNNVNPNDVMGIVNGGLKLFTEPVNLFGKKEEEDNDEHIINKRKSEHRRAQGEVYYFNKEIQRRRGEISRLEIDIKYLEEDIKGIFNLKAKERLVQELNDKKKKLRDLNKEFDYYKIRLTQWKEYEELTEKYI